MNPRAIFGRRRAVAAYVSLHNVCNGHRRQTHGVDRGAIMRARACGSSLATSYRFFGHTRAKNSLLNGGESHTILSLSRNLQAGLSIAGVIFWSIKLGPLF
jgi:hypothetical protein